MTGGTQGLGAAIAERFAEAGAAGIVIVGRDGQKGRGVAGRITEKTGVPVDVVAADLADIEAVRRIIPALMTASDGWIFWPMRRG